METNYSYCSGVACPIKEECKRYLPNPPDEPVWWVNHAYREETGQCPYFDPRSHGITPKL